MLDLIFHILIGIAIGMSVQEYRDCPKDKYTIDRGCEK